MPKTILYTTQVTSIGGKNGHIRSSDMMLDLDTAAIDVAGTGIAKVAGTNPVQLFAGGYASCFEAAIQAKSFFLNLDPGHTSVTAKVDVIRADAGILVEVELNISIPGLPRDTAGQIVREAHESCIFSKLVSNNALVNIVLL